MEPRLENNWIVGFTDGEGCFFLKTYVGLDYKTNHNKRKFICSFSITQKEEEILYKIRKQLGVGKVIRKNPSERNPVSALEVYRVQEIPIICKFFNDNILMTKQTEFKLWMKGFYLHRAIRNRHQMDSCANEIYSKIYNRMRRNC